jgi:hypothetical protein
MLAGFHALEGKSSTQCLPLLPWRTPGVSLFRGAIHRSGHGYSPGECGLRQGRGHCSIAEIPGPSSLYPQSDLPRVSQFGSTNIIFDNLLSPGFDPMLTSNGLGFNLSGGAVLDTTGSNIWGNRGGVVTAAFWPAG